MGWGWWCQIALLLCAHSADARQQQPTVSLTNAASAKAVASLEVEAAPRFITLHNIRHVGGRIAVYCLDSSRPVEEALALPTIGDSALDWEQLHVGGAYSVQASLPDSAQLGCSQDSQVVAYCQDCDGHSTWLPVVHARAGSRSGSTIAFILSGAHQPAAVAPASIDAASRRRLLQQAAAEPAPLGSCLLQVGDKEQTFEGCVSVPLNPSTAYQVYYTIQPTPDGKTRWVGGLKIDAAALGGQWSGFGFPASPNTMIGTHAIIMKECQACPSGASVDGYNLVGYVPADNVAGSFPITDMSAAIAPDGSLVAAFTAELDQDPGQLLAAPFNFVYAIGTLAPDDSLLPHPSAERPYGGKTMLLKAGMANGAPAPALGSEVQAPAAAIPVSDPSPVSDPFPSPAAVEASAADTSNCQLSVDGADLSFAACTPISGIGTDYTLMWSLEVPADGGPNSTLTLGLRAAAGGWVAVGFPAVPARMRGGSAMVLKTCPSCASGAEMNDYYLAAQSTAGVQPPSKLKVSGASGAMGSDGFMTGTIKVHLDSMAAANPAFPIILAAGPVSSDDQLLQHTVHGASSVSWVSGTSSGVQGEPANIAAMKSAHAWLMAVGWGLLIPLGILTARHGKEFKPPLWFHLHRALQVLGLACALAGFILIFEAVRQATGTSVSTYTTHRRLGIAAMSMGLFQLLALVLRPRPGTRLRKYWEPVHHWVGRAAAMVAVANIYEGIINVRQVGTWAVATYSVVFGLIMVLGLGLDVHKLLAARRQPPAALSNGNGAGDREKASLDGSSQLKQPADTNLLHSSGAGDGVSHV